MGRTGWLIAAVALVTACGDDSVGTATEASTTTGSTTMMMQETGTSGTTEAPMVTETGGGSMTAGETTGTTTTTTTTGGDPVCGDGNVDVGEECDDGAANGPGASCKDDCAANVCGDGDQGPDEECDQGPDNSDEGLCKSDCTSAGCGDGIVQPGEGCDDGNEIDDDACTNECCVVSRYLRGFVPRSKRGFAQCDDGNADNSDACTDACLLPACGDGYIQAEAGELCDDGLDNDDNGDCTSQCTIAACGDGLVHNAGSGSEECDDGNEVDVDTCSNLCVSATCEDGVKNAAGSDVDGERHLRRLRGRPNCAADLDCNTQICDGGTCALPKSCAQILEKDVEASSGTYTIDADGDGPGQPFEVICDMDTEGGGWTMIANLHSNRIPQSINRDARFFTAAWRQNLDGNEVTSNDQLTLASDVFGMLDAQDLIAGATDLRYSCADETRDLTADAIWTPTMAEWTDLLQTMIYSAQAATVKIAKNGGGYGDVQAFPTAANKHTYGCWHICGSCGPAQQNLSFQLGLCHNSPSQGDNNTSNTNHVAIGYHDGYQALRLECTADTPSNTPILNGTWRAWVR
ncbi:MAG: fibrinogen-like YCDxxxxGGGW domain-containing protein [Nannocystaceae bacterium]